MKQKYLILIMISMSLLGCNFKSTPDWEGCELEEPDFVKERRDSLNALKN